MPAGSPDVVHKTGEFLIPMTLQALANHGAFDYVESGQHRGGLVARKEGRSAKHFNFSTILGWGRFLAPARLPLFRFRSEERPIRRRSTSLLLALNLALVAVLMVNIKEENLHSLSVSAAPDVSVVNLPELELADFSFPSRDTFDVMSNRPLLEPSRRLQIPESLDELEQEYLTVELIGTYLSETGRAALVKLGTQDSGVWVREREYISSWLVERIEADRLHLRRIDQQRLVHLWPGS